MTMEGEWARKRGEGGREVEKEGGREGGRGSEGGREEGQRGGGGSEGEGGEGEGGKGEGKGRRENGRQEQVSGGEGGGRNRCRWGSSITHQGSISEYISHQYVSFNIHLHEQK